MPQGTRSGMLLDSAEIPKNPNTLMYPFLRFPYLIRCLIRKVACPKSLLRQAWSIWLLFAFAEPCSDALLTSEGFVMPMT